MENKICKTCINWAGNLNSMINTGHHIACPKHPKNVLNTLQTLMKYMELFIEYDEFKLNWEITNSFKNEYGFWQVYHKAVDTIKDDAG